MKKDKILLKEISRQIRRYRKINGYTQFDLAKKINVHKNTIKNFEKGNTIPNIGDLLKIANAFNISISSLFEEREVKEYSLFKNNLPNAESLLAKENMKNTLAINDLFPTGSQYYLLEKEKKYLLINTTDTQIQDNKLYAIFIPKERKILLRKMKIREYIVVLISLTNEIDLYKKSEVQIIGTVIKKIEDYSL